ncbi:hypothetical protein [Paenibacillus sacheonensis]|uniref:Uncharacterized protein n=1 Tax=Paenibacillus sacheonensis TaxID=742054 RepID=A0A7X5BXG0_9BACL|nr:hypothetical protein [Paenibacillus sacheonensis]MBM7568261.1 hypothetical protein [Paenibacillus sacheonensis]NBC68552.1 hypothetical protein [Paenibacillus sacheonensis]
MAIVVADTGLDRLAEAKERKHRMERAQRRQEQLRSRIRENERLIFELELKLQSEQEDVDKLTRMSLANLFHTLLRSKDEQLELERQEALAAALKLQEARDAEERMKGEVISLGDELTACGSADRDYERLLREKEELLRHSSAYANELAAMDADIADKSLLAKEIREALSAGRSVLLSLEDASNSLEKAENWGNWDLWGGGGMISTHMKHEHVDDAKRSIGSVNHMMRTFRDELADLERNVDIHVDISGMLKFGDYWFDGLITDWVVQKRINNAQDQTLDALHQVRTIVNRLQSEYTSAESVLAGLQSNRVHWIETSKAE